jgi:hypothetical protein
LRIDFGLTRCHLSLMISYARGFKCLTPNTNGSACLGLAKFVNQFVVCLVHALR